MSEIDDLLASLPDDEEEKETPAVDPAKLGYALRQEQKSKKALEKELKELREFRDAQLAEKRTGALRAAGLNDFHTEVFSKLYEEVTPETVAEYKVRAGLEVAPEEAPAPETPQAGFAPSNTMSGVGPVPKVITQADLEQLMRENPAAGWELLNSGKVVFNNAQPRSIT